MGSERRKSPSGVQVSPTEADELALTTSLTHFFHFGLPTFSFGLRILVGLAA